MATNEPGVMRLLVTANRGEGTPREECGECDWCWSLDGWGCDGCEWDCEDGCAVATAGTRCPACLGAEDAARMVLDGETLEVLRGFLATNVRAGGFAGFWCDEIRTAMQADGLLEAVLGMGSGEPSAETIAAQFFEVPPIDVTGGVDPADFCEDRYHETEAATEPQGGDG